jgi:transposase InsO family protein
VKLIKHAHEDLGHFGVRRTYSLLQIHYWWRGMQLQVQALVARCVVCDRVQASFKAPMPQLQPLPIMGLGYRWSLDFAGPLPVIPRHNKYVLVMIEHFSKWIELVALPDKFSEGAAYSFLDRVLSRFGAPAKVLTDQGREFLGEFQTLCEQTMIDHRTTSRDHPEVDGLAERMVQTVKKGRFSKHASLASFSPYYLLFGRHPVLPHAIQADTDTVLANMDNPDTWALVSEQRAELFKRVMPMALENLSIAQHRDTLRYATIRGGGYRPQVRRFCPRDYVYLQQTAPTTLDVTTGRIILRVREVLGSGLLLLEGRDSKLWKDHSRNCAPCHLPHIDGTVHPGTSHIPAGLRCRLCGSAKRAATMVVCDICSTG